MIEKETVKHIAKLARLKLSEKEIEKYQKELAKILEFIEKLKEVDVSKVDATFTSIEIENVMREDEEREDFKDKILNLIKAAPETKDGYFKVKKII